MKLNPRQRDRAAGTLVGLATGDALGAGYEFGPALAPSTKVGMIGGGPFGFAPGEWTDDTSMALGMARGFLAEPDNAYEPTVTQWFEWSKTAQDIGVQTAAVFSLAGRTCDPDAGHGPAPSPAALENAAREVHQRTGRSGGNGSLMRTAPLGLTYLSRGWEWQQLRAMVMRQAHRYSALTHFDADAGDAAALWSAAIAHAVLTGELNIRAGLDQEFHVHGDPGVWRERIERAERSVPSDFTKNGWVVEAFMGAWSAIHSTRQPGIGGAEHFRAALEAAVRGGNDTDTVAAIAGSLLGAAYGLSAVPAAWLRDLHGWPGLRARDLAGIGLTLATGQGPDGVWPNVPAMDYSGWPGAEAGTAVAHPDDPGVLLGTVGALRTAEYDAVVSLCRVGAAQAHVTPRDHAEFWLMDEAAADANPHLDFIADDVVATVRRFRAEGKTVLLHCVRMESRTPTAAALYGAAVAGGRPLEALARIKRVLPHANPNAGFMRLLARRSSATPTGPTSAAVTA